jgi:shikimate dehydrogenase
MRPEAKRNPPPRAQRRVARYWACILGQPVGHSLSPAMHNVAFARLGVDAHYELREVDAGGLRAAVNSLRDPSCLGANVTAPHKQAVMAYLDDLLPEARLLGAVNTIISRNGRLIGDNTDAEGLARWMERAGIVVHDQRALVLGAGGAARAAVLALARQRARSIRVLNRTVERAEMLVADLQRHLPSPHLDAGPLAEAADATREPAAVVLNATSLGHQGGAPNVHLSWYGFSAVAVELVYMPPETEFMRAARAAGARAENGLGMLVHQAVLAFERWTGQIPPVDLYEETASQALRGARATSAVAAQGVEP